jgi:hypothetical protein
MRAKLEYFDYVVAWYAWVHPGPGGDQFRTSIGGKTRTYSGGSWVYPDIVNDTRHLVWKAKTGLRRIVPRLVPGFSGPEYQFVLKGTDQPQNSNLQKGNDQAATAAQALGNPPYHPGIIGDDPQLEDSFKRSNCIGGACTVFFADGTVMLVWIPTSYLKGKNQQRIDIQGVIAYQILQRRQVSTVSAGVISQEDYEAN